VLRNSLYISKDFYDLPDFEDDQEKLERYCSSELGQKTLVNDMKILAEHFSTTDLAKSSARDMMKFFYLGKNVV